MRKRHNYLSYKKFIALCAGVAIAGQSVTAQTPNPKVTKSITLGPYQDTWGSAVERWWDISSYRSNSVDHYNQYNDWITNGQPNGKFSYAVNPRVTLTYDTAPGVPYFVGHIKATGLKPNFAYQLKLTGKPVSGPRGMGKNSSYITATSKTVAGTPVYTPVIDPATGQPSPVNGDDWTNQQLGYAGRWWNDSNASGNTNAVTDSVYASTYPTDTIYGYIFMGDFVTDKYGNYDKEINGRYSYHITWQDWQNTTLKHVLNPLGPFSISGHLDNSATSHYYGYGSPNGPSSAAPQQDGFSSVRLWYEYEAGRSGANGVTLANGTYHCRLLLTEETFHNTYSGGTNNTLGGKWKTVMATEDFSGSSPDNDPSNDIVFSLGTPREPANLAAMPGDNQVSLSWTASAGATRYNVKRATISGGPYTLLSSTVTDTTFNDTTAVNGATYFYVVSAANTYGEGPISNEASATLQTNTFPAAPTGLRATSGNAQVSLSWDAVPGATGYTVKRRTSSGQYDTFTDVSTNSHTDTVVINGTIYFYAVSAFNSIGVGPDSTEVTATPEQPVVPSAPGNLSATATSPNQINLTWTDTSSNENGFHIWRSTGGAPLAQIATVAANSNSYQDTGLTAATGYSYVVTSYNSEGDSIDSNTASATTLAPAPQSFMPIADAYVRSGTYASKNFGTATVLEVKTSTSSKENRDSYFKFDLNGASGLGSTSTIQLRVYAALSASGTVTTAVYPVASTTWTETGLTWNNKPVSGAALSSKSVTGTGYVLYTFDITNYVKAELAAGRKTISLAIHDPANVSPTLFVRSKEYGTISNRPQLLITY